MIAWIMAHQALCAGLGVAVLDFVFAVNPKVQSNGVIHWFYGFLVGEKSVK